MSFSFAGFANHERSLTCFPDWSIAFSPSALNQSHIPPEPSFRTLFSFVGPTLSLLLEVSKRREKRREKSDWIQNGGHEIICCFHIAGLLGPLLWSGRRLGIDLGPWLGMKDTETRVWPNQLIGWSFVITFIMPSALNPQNAWAREFNSMTLSYLYVCCAFSWPLIQKKKKNKKN